ncbi:hypothetical protein GLOTRDRAFT_138471 [Gloeophyllum trabeum ATCC 11539]|uniref:Uncharacterized protein n=1 Tax=Gloeophyllum trabeum (strain ATCC 11539 / FP-39264 / Madison 617) TaxID=670483 RepID=S7Q837_GLOTA|nr:uncharacterized protein GLOTRDRAFT_138471 [Gloeophyllum trabeum ATCC 11539]EPQ55608.1 hypothetical protein GLOTRDRAFT_138471 [Gloeophyllum trabeum ATCC 11539]
MSAHARAGSGSSSDTARMKRDVRFKDPVVEPESEEEEGSEFGGDQEGAVGPGAREAEVARESKQSRAVATSSSWTDFDFSIMLALAAPIGNWLTGTDHLKNLFLICLLIFYLHQIIEVPWQLYQSALPRRIPPGVKTPPEPDSTHSHLAELARSELRQHEFIYLALSLASPFIGAYLLRHGLAALSSDGAAPPLSWFSITLFMFAVGIRPWSHLIKRLRARTHDLHDTVHYHHLSQTLAGGLEAESKIRELAEHVRTLEAELQRLKHAAEDSKALLEDEHDDLADSVKDLKGSLKKHERKSDAARTAHEKRLHAVETTLGFVLEHLKHQEKLRTQDPWNKSISSANGFVQAHPFLHYLASTLLYIPNKLLAVVTPPASPLDGTNGFVEVTHSPPGAKSHASQVPGLETIDEDSDDATLSPPSGEADTKDRPKRGRRGRRRATSRQRSAGYSVRDLAIQAVTLPYRAAERVLVIATSPIHKHLM